MSRKRQDASTSSARRTVRPAFAFSAKVLLLSLAILCTATLLSGLYFAPGDAIKPSTLTVRHAARSPLATTVSRPQRASTRPSSPRNATPKATLAAIQALLRTPTQAPFSQEEPPPWIAILGDRSRPVMERARAASKVALIDSEEAFRALEEALVDADPYLKSVIAEALGSCPHGEAPALVHELLEDPDEAVCRGAIRGLAKIGDAEALGVLQGILADPLDQLGVRDEAALALGELRDPAALETLMRAAIEVDNRELEEHVLEGIGMRPLAESEEFFRSFLESPETATESKASALEALGFADGSTSLLMDYAAHPEARLRESAALALAMATEPAEIGEGLLHLLEAERSPEVRLRLYQALEAQSGYDLQTLENLVHAESHPRARLAALQLLASSTGSIEDTASLRDFETRVVGELTDIALNSPAGGRRLGAVIALQKARTPAALQGLETIAVHSGDGKVVKAARSALES